MSSTFLVINDEALSQKQALNYLAVAGKLQSFITEIIRQYIIAQELQAHADLSPTPQVVSQVLNGFCQQQQISDEASFQQWLYHNHINYEIFCKSLVQQWRLQNLIARITAPQLYEYFIQRKEQLNQVHLSCIVVQTQELANELRDQLEETSFAQIVQEYSLADNCNDNGRMQPISQAKLPEKLRVLIDMAQPSEVIGPITINDRWYLFRFESFEEVPFEAARTQLQTELFEDWLAERVKKVTITLEVIS